MVAGLGRGSRRGRECWSSGGARPSAMVSTTSEDLPDPDTPQTPTCTPRGMRTSRPRRLFSRAPVTCIQPVGSRRRSRRAIAGTCPSSTARVTDCGLSRSTRRPPARPGPGPISITSSAARMSVGSCSTAMTVFPASRNSVRVRASAATSEGCRPREGSSSSTVMPTSPSPSTDASLMRCASPADSVQVVRFSWR